MSSHTQSKRDVPVPDWAEGYDVGDTIEFKNPTTDGVDRAQIIGFSTVQDNLGLPVVDANTVPGGIRAKEIAITERFHVNGKR